MEKHRLTRLEKVYVALDAACVVLAGQADLELQVMYRVLLQFRAHMALNRPLENTEAVERILEIVFENEEEEDNTLVEEGD